MPDSIDLGSYSVFVPPDPFEDHVGPFYYRITGDARQAGSVHCVLPTEPRHGNYAGGVHGGATLDLRRLRARAWWRAAPPTAAPTPSSP